MLKARKIYFGLIVIYLFLYIYNPPIIAFNSRSLLDCLNFFIVFIFSIKHARILFPKPLFKIACMMVPFYIYVILHFVYIAIFSQYYNLWDYMIELYSLFFLSIKLFLFVDVLLIIFNKINLEKLKCLTDAYIYIGVIQLLMVLLAFFVPGVRDVFNGLIQEIPDETMQSAMENLEKTDKRGYGLSANLFDGFGYIVSYITALIFVNGRQNKKNYILFLFMIIIPLLNTRTGIILDFSIIFIASLWYGKENFIKTIMVLVLSALFIILSWDYIAEFIPEETAFWIETGADEISNLIFNQEMTGVFYVLLYNNLVFPDDLIFGVGTKPEVYSGIAIDNGYVQCIWRYGLLGTMILLFCFTRVFVYVYLHAKYINNEEMQIFSVCSFVIFIIYLFKIYSIINIGAYAIFIPLFVFCLLNYR